MRTMKDSGIEWVGRVPQSWSVNPIRAEFQEVTEKNKLGLVKNALKFTYGNIVKKDNFDADDDNYVADTILNYTVVNPGTIMLNGLNLNFDFVSQRVALVKERGIITSAYIAFAPNSNGRISSQFITYLLKAYDGCKAFHNMGGGVRKILNFSELKKQYIVYPTLVEQQRIADFLDAKCAEIDALTADIQAQIDTLEQYKRSVITETVTKGLNPNAEMKDSGIEWVEQMPMSWNTVPNKYLMYKIKSICPIYNGENILSLTTNGVIIRDLNGGGKMPTSFDGYQKIVPGNLLMCLFDIDVTPRCIGLIKDYGLTSPAYSQFAMKDGAYAPYYYYYYLMVDYTKELLHMAKNLRHSLTEDQLGAIKAPNPPYEEQVQIAEFLDKKCVEISRVIEDKNKQLATLDEYKKSLIFEYVTGKKEIV
ncbi:restriction endonuclease subunit S [Ruminococcus sp.]|uniref:restriction endonuclease subunit S n=1 Tax=Ruminococcus sp. TaxID=41978 RepID=UPI0025FD58C1|nr:restriction endonuclease subunit S [Ruminococcus sp.]MBD9051973.1 restriction endonuclease subunit S [Ruminococcus sp.]MBE5719020.1 restriction endonuclease subunit S [Ruminiclostridium sp.]